MRLTQVINVLFLLGICMPVTSHADVSSSPSVELGAKGGYALVTLYRGNGVQGSSQIRARNSFLAGVSSLLTMYVTDQVQLGAQAELLMVRRGAEAEANGLVVTSYDFNYLELPAMGRVKLPVSSWIEPYAVVGPRFGFLLRVESTDINGNVRDESDGTNKFDLGISAGLGALFHVGSRTMLSLEARYDQSVMNRIDASVETSADQRHRAFFLIFGASIGVGEQTSAY